MFTIVAPMGWRENSVAIIIDALGIARSLGPNMALLLGTTLVCVMVALLSPFLVQGFQPATWWEKVLPTKITRNAMGPWVALLAAWVGPILMLRKDSI